jgi:hypothetical protein
MTGLPRQVIVLFSLLVSRRAEYGHSRIFQPGKLLKSFHKLRHNLKDPPDVLRTEFIYDILLAVINAHFAPLSDIPCLSVWILTRKGNAFSMEG